LWASLDDVYVKGRRHGTNIAVALDADGGVSISPDSAPPAGAPGARTPEQMRAAGYRPVTLRTRA